MINYAVRPSQSRQPTWVGSRPVLR